MIKVNIGAVILKNKDGDKSSGKCSSYKLFLQALNVQNHLQVLSQQTRDNTGLQEECRSEDKGNVEDKENDFIAECESMLQSYCSR